MDFQNIIYEVLFTVLHSKAPSETVPEVDISKRVDELIGFTLEFFIILEEITRGWKL